jgi:AraC-like DNA-binding protein
MQAVPLIRTTALAPALQLLRRIGAPADRLLEASRLRPDVLQRADALVPFGLVNGFFEHAARTQGIDGFGLHAVRDVSPLRLGGFGRAMASGGTLGGALEASIRARSAFNSAARAAVTRDGGDVVLRHDVAGTGRDGHAQLALMSVGLTANLVRAVAGPRWRPGRITVAGPPTRAVEALPALSGADVVFHHAVTTVRIPVELLALPLPRGEQAPSTDDDWLATAPARDFAGSVRQVIAALLPGGYPDVHLVSEAVGMRLRTFQRRLQEDGTSHGRLVAEARLATACRLLREPDRKVIDAAFDLGYSDPAHFTRAFRAWTGLTPREYRNARCSSPGPAGHAKRRRGGNGPVTGT